jgi:hypothetical protein
MSERPAMDNQFRVAEWERKELIAAKQMAAAHRREWGLLKSAELRIQRILIELESETGKAIEHVEVDVRNFAQLATEIVLRNGPRY